MSILIKGMEMPQTCSECGFYHHREDDSYYDYEVCSAINMIIGDRYPHPNEKNRYNVYEISCKRRHERCPLIEVPTHGRLIDADELLRAAWENFDFVPRWMVKEAPIVIPADEDGET